MAYNEHTADRIRDILRRRRGVSEKAMFGGLAFLVNEHMACGVIKDDVVLRVGREAADELLERPHVRPMDFTGKPLAGYVYVAPPGYKDSRRLRALVGQAVAFARTLPVK